jgi:hypothetical protein
MKSLIVFAVACLTIFVTIMVCASYRMPPDEWEHIAYQNKCMLAVAIAHIPVVAYCRYYDIK